MDSHMHDTDYDTDDKKFRQELSSFKKQFYKN